jgi:hypothetical protein
MLAVQDGLVTPLIVNFTQAAGYFGQGWFRDGPGQRLPRSIADPGTLFLAGILDVKEADRLAVLLKFVFDFAREGQRLGTGQIEATILELITLKPRAVEYGDGNQAAGFGMARLAGPLEHGDSA